MTESQFIKDNIDYWAALEKLLRESDPDPDRLQQLFVKVSSDLSYASTYYPNRSVRLYLNKLTQQVFDTVEKESQGKLSFDQVGDFFRYVLPLELYRSRKQFLFAFLIFFGAVVIGMVSTAHSDDFAALILGDSYIAMTEQNINEGDPMAVYKDTEQVDMFLGITINNVRVSFLAFVGGIFAGLGTLILLLSNGIMVGAFQYYFYQKGLLATSFFTIWIHGTIEISAIIIAGAAGFVLGSGLLFPGTYSRGVSLQISAKRAVRIIVGTVPLFIIAGFLESFVTRLTDMPLIVKATIILLSLVLIVGMYIIYPAYVHKYYGAQHDYEVTATETVAELSTDDVKLSYGESLSQTFGMYRAVGGHYFSLISKYLFVPAAIILALFVKYGWEATYDEYETIIYFPDTESALPVMGCTILGIAVALVISVMLYVEQECSTSLLLQYLRRHLMMAILLVSPLVATFFLGEGYWTLVLLIFYPPQFIVIRLYEAATTMRSDTFLLSFYAWVHCIVHLLVIGLFHYLLLLSLNLGAVQYMYDFLTWHDVFSVEGGSVVFYSGLVITVITLAMVPLYCFSFLYSYKSMMAGRLALDLKRRYELFGTESSIFESKA